MKTLVITILKTLCPALSPKKLARLTAAMLLIPISAEAGNRGGIQAVCFLRWSSDSVNYAIAGVNNAAPKVVELSYVTGWGDFKNVTQFLAGVNCSVVLTSFESFHDDISGWNLADRSKGLSAYLIRADDKLGKKTPLSAVSNVVLSWQLEDGVNDDTWKKNMKTVLDNMDSTILNSGKVSLRRSVTDQATSLNGTSLSYARDNKKYSFPVYAEYHGLAKVDNAGIWSADGDFVYFPDKVDNKYENTASFKPISTSGKLADHIAAAAKRSGATTLWRPAMNLHTRSETNGLLKWTRSGNAWERTDASISFDSRESVILSKFLKGLK